MSEVIMNAKVETHGWIDLLGLGILKQIEKNVTANIPVISSNGITGMAIKGIVGAYVASKDGRLARLAGGALLVDAGESAAQMVMNMTGLTSLGSTGSTQSQDAW